MCTEMYLCIEHNQHSPLGMTIIFLSKGERSKKDKLLFFTTMLTPIPQQCPFHLSQAGTDWT